jgi:uncharacterized membrane protein YeaQ/YmgE (transglycosylase-associated protein family)
VARRYDTGDNSNERSPEDGQGVRSMAIEPLLVWLGVGALAGWLAHLVLSGRASGLGVSILIGVTGACIAGLLLPWLDVMPGTGMAAATAHAALGAVALLIVAGPVSRA